MRSRVHANGQKTDWLRLEWILQNMVRDFVYIKYQTILVKSYQRFTKFNYITASLQGSLIFRAPGTSSQSTGH